MKNFLKILGITIGSIVLVLYILFLIVPPFVNLEFLKPEIQKLAKENSKLNLDYSKLQIYTTPLLSMGVIINDIDVSFDDKTPVFKTDRIKAGIALPSLFTLTVKTSKCYIDNPYINLEVVDGKQYKIVSLVEEIINENIKKPKVVEKKTPEQIRLEEFAQKVLKLVRIKVPNILISNYKVDVNDSKTKNHLTLFGDELKLGYLSKINSFKLKTIAKLNSNDKENITANLDIKSFIPVNNDTTKEEIDPDETVEIPFIDIINIYQTYDLKMNVDVKLRLKDKKEEGIYAFGFLNVDNLTLKLSQIQLPESYFHSKFNKQRIMYESNIFVKADEKIDLAGFVQMGKKPHLKTAFLTSDIHFENMLSLLKGLLDSLNIKNDIAQIKTTGHLKANAVIDTDFKKLKSEGKILVENGSFINSKTNIGIKNIVANLLFDDNQLQIKDTKATINGSDVILKGSIDNASNTNIDLMVDNLSVPVLYNTFAPNELKRAYKLNSLNLTTKLNLAGKLDKLDLNLNAKLANLSLNDAKKTMFVLNDLLNVNAKLNSNTINAKIDNAGFKFNIPSMRLYTNASKILVDVDNEKITINPFDFIYNKNSKVNIKGDVKNYLKNPDINIFLDGKMSTNDIKTTLGNEVAYYFDSKGNIPFKVNVTGDSKKQNLLAQIYSDSSNYITPVDFIELVNQPTLIQADVKLKGSKISIKNSGLFKMSKASFTNDLDSNQQGKKELVELSSIIDNGHINLFRVKIANDLKARLSIMKKSSFILSGRMLANGSADNLNFLGGFKVSDVKIPELLINADTININFLGKQLTLNANKVDLNGSVIDASLKTSLKPASIVTISDIKAKSDLINVDKAMVVAEKAMAYVPPAPKTSKASSASSQANIPVNANGKFFIKKITTGDIVLNDTRGKLLVYKNDLIIDNMRTQAFKGNIRGSVVVNLISQLITARLNGQNIDSNDMLTNAAGMKDMISGVLSFKTDISLKGSTYEEQVKSLKGNVGFEMKNGQYGPFAKLENFFLAENIRENPVFKATIGAILEPILTIDSTHFEALKGNLNFKDGTVYLEPITSRGDILCILIKGNMSLLTNMMDTKVRVRLASSISDMLGPLAMANPVNLIKNAPGLNIVNAKLFSFFTQVVTESEYKEIPDFSSNHSDMYATKFQIVLNGDVAKPLKLVKSFKWLSLQSDMDKAKEFSDNYIKEQEELAREALIKKLQEEYEQENKVGVGIKKVLQMDTTAPEVKKILAEQAKQKVEQTKEQAKENIENKKQEVKKATEQKVQQAVNNAQAQVQTKLDEQKATAEKRRQEAIDLKNVQNKFQNAVNQKTQKAQETTEIKEETQNEGVQ